MNAIGKARASLLLLTTLLFTACASLTETQIKAVNAFAKTTEDVSDYPSLVLTELENIRYDVGQWAAATIDDPATHQDELDKIHQFREDQLKDVAKADISFKTLQEYAKALQELTSSELVENANKSSEELGNNLDELVGKYNTDFGGGLPTGLGAVATKASSFVAGQLILRKQAQLVQEFVPKGDVVIKTMTDNLVNFLKQDEMKALIDGEAGDIKTTYKRYLVKRAGSITLEDDRHYLDLLRRMDNVRALNERTQKACLTIQKAHGKLVSEVAKKRSVLESYEELKSAFDELKALHELARKINTTHSS